MKIKVKAMADKRIFCLYATLNATVYGNENADMMHPVCLKVRDYLNRRNLLLGSLRQLFTKYPKEFYYRFRDWMLSHSDPPEFKEINDFWRRNDSKDLDEFKKLLRGFWDQGKIEELWQEFGIEYESAIKEAQKNGEIAVKQIIGYLNMSDLGIKELVIIPNLLDSYNIGLGPTIDRTAYAILGPSQNGFSTPRIEHELLHSIINPLTEDFNRQKRSKLREYIIRTMVLRINSSDSEYYASRREKHIQQSYGQINQWLDWLKKFELGDQPFDQYLRDIRHPLID